MFFIHKKDATNQTIVVCIWCQYYHCNMYLARIYEFKYLYKWLIIFWLLNTYRLCTLTELLWHFNQVSTYIYIILCVTQFKDIYMRRSSLLTVLWLSSPPYHLDKASARPLPLPGIRWTARSISWVAVTSNMFLATVPRNGSQERPELSKQTTAMLSQWMTTALSLSLCFHRLSAIYTLIILRWTMVHGMGRLTSLSRGSAYTKFPHAPPC